MGVIPPPIARPPRPSNGHDAQPRSPPIQRAQPEGSTTVLFRAQPRIFHSHPKTWRGIYISLFHHPSPLNSCVTHSHLLTTTSTTRAPELRGEKEVKLNHNRPSRSDTLIQRHPYPFTNGRPSLCTHIPDSGSIAPCISIRNSIRIAHTPLFARQDPGGKKLSPHHCI